MPDWPPASRPTNAAPKSTAPLCDYLLRGAADISPEHQPLFEQRAGITGLAVGVLVLEMLSSAIEIALKSYGGMFEAGNLITTSSGGDRCY